MKALCQKYSRKQVGTNMLRSEANADNSRGDGAQDRESSEKSELPRCLRDMSAGLQVRLQKTVLHKNLQSLRHARWKPSPRLNRGTIFFAGYAFFERGNKNVAASD